MICWTRATEERGLGVMGCRGAAEGRELLLFWHSYFNSHTISVLPFGSAGSAQSAVPPFWIKKPINGCEARSNLLYQCFSLAEAFIVIRKSILLAPCDWGEMKGQDLKAGKEDVIFLVDRLGFYQGCVAFQLERVWKLNLKLPPSASLLTFCMELKFA